MKPLFKFALLSALIVGGKLAKQPATTVVARKQVTKPANRNSIILVHQVLTSEPVQPTREKDQPQQSGNGLLAELF